MVLKIDSRGPKNIKSTSKISHCSYKNSIKKMIINIKNFKNYFIFALFTSFLHILVYTYK